MRINVAPDYVEFSGLFHDIVENFYEKDGEILWNGRNVIKRFEYEGKLFVVKKCIVLVYYNYLTYICLLFFS